MNWVVLDYETASMIDLKKVGHDRYAEDPTTEILCLCYCLNNGVIRQWFPGQPCPEDFKRAIAEGHMFVAHQAGFEQGIYRNIQVPVYGWPAIPLDQWHDTMAVCAMRVLPLGLERVGPVLGLEHNKDMEGNRLTLGLSRVNKQGYLPVRTPEIIKRVGTYCDGDVAEQRELHRRVGWLPPPERKVWLHNQVVNQRGVRLDMPLVRAMQDVVDRASKPLIAEFGKLTGGLGLGQTAKVKAWMQTQGVQIDSLDKEHLTAILGDDEEEDEAPEGLDDLPLSMLPENVERALRIRQLIGSSSVKKLAKMQQIVCADGRAHGLLQYHGTGPGRNAGRLFQPQNFPRGTNELIATPVQAKVDAIMSGDLEYIEMLLGPAVEAVVGSLRHTILAADDHLLISGDFSGIQARTVLGLAGQHDKTALMAAGADVYIDMACDIYEMKKPTNKAEIDFFKHHHTRERQTGKNSVLGLGFQMGSPKFKNKYAKDQPDEFCQHVVDVYRKDWAPLVPELWYALQNAALDTVKYQTPHEAYGILYALEDRWLTARLPGGNKLWYFNPQLVKRLMPWSTPEEPDVRLAWTYQSTKSGKWKTIDAFGGQLTENAVMGIERQIMVDAAERLETEGFPIILDVHDEQLIEVLTSRADPEMVRQIMTDVKDWTRQLMIPIAVDTWAGDRYRK